MTAFLILLVGGALVAMLGAWLFDRSLESNWPTYIGLPIGTLGGFMLIVGVLIVIASFVHALKQMGVV